MADHDFAVVDSETLYTGKIFALRADEVRMPGGRTARREVVEHYGAVAVVAADEDGRVALVYQYRHPFRRRLWELPAGLLDAPGEEPHVSAARELVEEAGLAAEHWQVLVDLDSAPGFSDESVRVYLATGLRRVDRPQAHDEEADLRLEWFALDDAVAMALRGEICNSIAVAGLLAYRVLRDGSYEARPVDAVWTDRPTAFAARRNRP
ncbi:NUDIX hydrolase [Mycobacterium sp. MYCO198283]|uniref:NUDIX domain-containing protein n=1 Tax=Mycobacterium sp. MYCO198283 TaxID=2883505 RepID=UPI001E4FA3AA|nr:NUDIX hydrolase [Mycobacterium sp. MYCO198283]MCG5433110.1 NUDIX hydrolase [Mycobacterium sp. MYCO198283]